MESGEKKRILSLFNKKKYTEKDRNLLESAINFLDKKKSKNIPKLIKISNYLLKKGFGKETVISSLIFLDFDDEDSLKIKDEFGEEILYIVKTQKKLEEIELKSEKNNEEVTREVILSSVEKIEAIILNLALKLIELKIEKRNEAAKKIIKNYLPLANRLGLEKIKKDLGNESFKILNPRKYLEISNFLKISKNERERYIKKITKELSKEVAPKIKNVKIKGREKQIYSIYEKITKRKIPLDKQKDQFGVRIITEREEDCYIIFEIINEKYTLVENTLKDFIKNPKENGYRSLHFCIKDGEKVVEIQVRTTEMDEMAEEGAASHWTYKKIKGDAKFEKKTAWLKEVLKLKKKENSFFEEIKINLFKDKIYCYTPKGKTVSLPPGSSTLDFAYQIHAEVGNKSVGALINEKFAPLKTELENGDTVEIITNKFQRPRRDWLKFVKTKYAKKMISREVKRYEDIPVPKSVSISEEILEKYEIPAKIKEFPNHILNFAKCCNPLPDDEIVGILRSYRRALIHKRSCEKIQGSKKHEMKAFWTEVFTKPSKIFVETTDRSGILADIINTISRKNFKVKEANAKLTGNNFAECYLVVSPGGIEELKEIIGRIKKIRGVKKIWLE
ncbi:MAG: TGS domain-containing protein [archaeon]|nr:TGS domain-containing protein [archaeon]